MASLGGLLVEHGDRALLIDAGFGPESLPPDPGTPRGAIRGGALPGNLAALGRSPAGIEAVAFTHLPPTTPAGPGTPLPTGLSSPTRTTWSPDRNGRRAPCGSGSARATPRGTPST